MSIENSRLFRFIGKIKTVLREDKLSKFELLDDIIKLLSEYKSELLNNNKKFKQSDVIITIENVKKTYGEDVVLNFNLDSFFRGLSIILSLRRNRKTMIEKYFNSYIDSLKERINNIEFNNMDFTNDEDYEELQKITKEHKLKIDNKTFKNSKIPLQIELLKMQEWIKKTDYKLAIVFEGRDSSGKGSAIKTITEFLQPKYFNVQMFDVPTDEEKNNWFKRYEDVMPKSGRITFFDRSWYNRAVNDPVMGYCTDEEYKNFMINVNLFEENLENQEIHLIKFWFSISQDMQKVRFKLRQNNPLKSWKFSENDMKTLKKWNQFSIYKERMFIETSTLKNPWIVVDGDDKRLAQINVLKYILNSVDYEGKDEEVIGKYYPEIIIPLI